DGIRDGHVTGVQTCALPISTSLDLTIQAQYLNLLRDLQRQHGLALIFITHNLGIVAKMCDQLAVMYAGRVVESGPVSRVFNAPRSEERRVGRECSCGGAAER